MLYPNDNGLEPPSEFIKKLIGSVEQQGLHETLWIYIGLMQCVKFASVSASAKPKKEQPVCEYQLKQYLRNITVF